MSVTDCRSFGTPRVFNSEKECLASVSDGKLQLEAQGWMIMDSHCHRWGAKV
jgi:hypothetical protein